MKKILRIAAGLVAAATLATACSCTQKQQEQNNFGRNLSAMGTFATLIVADVDGNGYGGSTGYSDGASAFAALAEEVSALLFSVEGSLSATLTTSCIYSFNQAEAGEKVELDKTAYDVLTLAMEVYAATDGYYNPAVYDSVLLYGFPLLFDDPTTLPDQSSVEAFRDLASHFGELILSEENGAYYATKPQYTVFVGEEEYSLKVDLGGIGKGWCADRVSEILRDRGYRYGYFSFGSSSITVMNYAYSESGVYNFTVDDPRVFGGSFCKIPVSQSNLSTSGDSQQYYVVDGVRYCHIIDPTTGSPIRTGVASVTVVGGSAAEDDALTTALSCMGKQKAVEFINDHLSDRTVVMLVIEDGVGKVVANRPQEVTLMNPDYVLANTVQDGKIILG